MTNPAGTRTATQVVKYLRERGWHRSDRIPQKGSSDEGDVEIKPGWIAEVKYRGKGSTNAGLGQPGWAQLDGWMAETEAERKNRRAKHAVLVVKRTGTSFVGDWFAYISMAEFINLTEGVHLPEDENVVVQMSFRDYLRLVR